MKFVSTSLNGRLALRATAVGAAAVLTLSACGSSSNGTSSSSSSSSGTPVKGGTAVVVEGATAPSLDPYPKGAAGMATLEFLSLIYEELLTTDDGGNVVAGGRSLSESFTTPDPTTVVVKLRQGVKFHSGDPMTADDVVYTFTHAKDPAVGNTTSLSRLSSLASVVATDPATVTFKLSAPDSGFLATLASDQSPIIEKKWTEDHAGDLNKYPNGTGAFKVDSFVPNSDFTASAFADYWDPKLPYLDGVEVKTMPDVSTRVAAVRTGDADIVEFPFDQAKLLSSLKDVTIHDSAPLLGEPLAMSCKLKPLDDVRVRQAVLTAIDFDALRSQVVPGQKYPLSYMVAPDFPKWGVKVGDEFPYAKPDVEKAKALLSDAGYPNGVAFDVEVINSPSFDYNKRAVELIAQQVAKAGITISIKPYDLATILGHIFSGQQMAGQSGLPVNDDPDSYWSNVSKEAASGCTDTHIQELITQEKAATDDATRADLIKQINVYAEQQAFNPILFSRPSRITTISKEIQGYSPVPAIRWWSLRSAWKNGK